MGKLEIGEPANFLILDGDPRENFEIRLDTATYARFAIRDGVIARNRLLEDCLRAIKQVRVTAERERAEQIRKELMVQIEKERAQARERAADQRKRLQIEVGDETEEPRP